MKRQNTGQSAAAVAVAAPPAQQPKLPYPSLKADQSLANQLLAHVASLRKRAEQAVVNAEQTKAMQTRKSARDNFTYALLLGVAEARLKSEAIPNLKPDASWAEATIFCSEISQQIESGMWVSHESEVNKEYSKKFRTLQVALRHDEN